MSNTDSNGRRKAGPADPETVRKLFMEKTESTHGQSRPKPEDKPKPKKKSSTSLKDLLNPKVKRERIAGKEGKSLMDAVDEGVRQGTESEKKRK